MGIATEMKGAAEGTGGPASVAADAAGAKSAKVASPRQRLKAMMREEILTAARGLVQEGGVQALSMRALGRAVGVTAPTLYDYFASKEEVLDALYLEGTTRLRAAMEEAIARTEPGRERLRALAQAYRRFALADPDLYLLIFGRVDASYRPGDAELECGLGVFELAVEANREAIARGELRPGDPATMAFAAWALAHGIVTLEICGMANKCGDVSPEDAYTASLDLLFQGTGVVPAAEQADASGPGRMSQTG